MPIIILPCPSRTSATEPGALAKRRAEQRHTHRRQARDAGMEDLVFKTSIGRTLGDPRQLSAFVLEVAFTWWKLFTNSVRTARHRRQRLLCQQKGARKWFRHHQPDVSDAVKTGLLTVHHGGGNAGAASTCPRRRMAHRRKCCMSVRDNKIPEPSALRIRARGEGRRVVFRSGKDLRVGLSSPDNNEDGGQGKRASNWSDQGCQEDHARNGSPAVCGVESPTPMIHMAQLFPLSHASGGAESEETATPQYFRSPFVAGGPLCAEYPSYWTVTGVSVLNAVDARPLDAWTSATAAEKQQKVWASRPVPRKGYKRRGFGTPTSSSRFKHRCTEIVTGEGCFPFSMDIEHHHQRELKTSAFYAVSRDPSVSVRASSAPAVDRGVGRRPLLPNQGVTKTVDEVRKGPWEASSMCFGRYMCFVD